MLISNYTLMIHEFEYNGKAMGTSYFVSIVCESEALSNNIYKMVKHDIEYYEAIFSRFDENSELSILNSKKEMEVSPIFMNVTKRAYELFIETRGAFNPLLSISRLGYDINFDNLNNKKIKVSNSVYNIDFSSVIIDEDNSAICLKEGQNLDFGGILKGYLAEVISDKVMKYSPDIIGVIINLGGDIHTNGLDKDRNKFVFKIYNPIDGSTTTSVVLNNESLSTSGTYKRTWNIKDKKINHILSLLGTDNPHTGIVSSSIICDDGASSEAYAKAFLSVGIKEAVKILKDKKYKYVIILDNGEVIKNT